MPIVKSTYVFLTQKFRKTVRLMVKYKRYSRSLIPSLDLFYRQSPNQVTFAVCSATFKNTLHLNGSAHFLDAGHVTTASNQIIRKERYLL